MSPSPLKTAETSSEHTSNQAAGCGHTPHPPHPRTIRKQRADAARLLWSHRHARSVVLTLSCPSERSYNTAAFFSHRKKQQEEPLRHAQITSSAMRALYTLCTQQSSQNTRAWQTEVVTRLHTSARAA